MNLRPHPLPAFWRLDWWVFTPTPFLLRPPPPLVHPGMRKRGRDMKRKKGGKQRGGEDGWMVGRPPSLRFALLASATVVYWSAYVCMQREVAKSTGTCVWQRKLWPRGQNREEEGQQQIGTKRPNVINQQPINQSHRGGKRSLNRLGHERHTVLHCT